LTAPFDIDALGLLPDHLHDMWTLPQGDADFSMRSLIENQALRLPTVRQYV
jgi:REP element-mobilizing transposase RayT